MKPADLLLDDDTEAMVDAIIDRTLGDRPDDDRPDDDTPDEPVTVTHYQDAEFLDAGSEEPDEEAAPAADPAAPSPEQILDTGGAKTPDAELLPPVPGKGEPRPGSVLTESPEPPLEHEPTRQGYYLKMQYAVVARALFQGKNNIDIITALDEAGHPFVARVGPGCASPSPLGRRSQERRLAELLATPAFKEYFDQYQKNQFLASDRSVNRALRLLQPKALKKIVSLMESRSGQVQLDAALAILDMGGTRKKVSERRNINVEVPAALQERIFNQRGLTEGAGYRPKYRQVGAGATREPGNRGEPGNGKDENADPSAT